MLKRRILVIDDSESIHQDFCRILCSERPQDMLELDAMERTLFGETGSTEAASEEIFELDSAFQGEEGLAKVREALASGRPYALAFLDYRMPPGWNGMETLRQLRKVAPTLPVVLCSAYSDYSWEEMAQEFGQGHHLTELRKPFDKYDVHQLVLTLSEPRGASGL